MHDKDETSRNATRAAEEIGLSASEIDEAIEEMSERAQGSLSPQDRRADYSSISPRDTRQAA